MKVNFDPLTIHETKYEQRIAAGISSGHLCAKLLAHGDPCGRKIDKRHGLHLCTWHSESELGLPHYGDDSDEIGIGPKTCTRCHKRPVAFRVSRLCGNCQKVTRHHRRRDQRDEIAVGHIVE